MLARQFLLSTPLITALVFTAACSSDLPQANVKGSDSGDGDMGVSMGDGDDDGDGDSPAPTGDGDGDISGGDGDNVPLSDGRWTAPINDWPSDACINQAQSLVDSMSNEEKASQMVMELFTVAAPTDIQSGALGNVFAGGGDAPSGGSDVIGWGASADSYLSAGAASNTGIPPMFGVDAVHGHNKATGTVIFPHNIGLGATRNAELVEHIGEITAIEMAASGANWTFGPMLSVSHDDRWGRAYESFSENPDDVALLGAAIVSGLQGRNGLGSGHGVVACAKHFAGDGQAAFDGSRTSSWRGGTVDRAEITMSEADLRKFAIDPYVPAIQAGLGSVMVGDSKWNGTFMTESSDLMTRILKEELGFEGFVTTDWDAVNTTDVGVVSAVNAGVDMMMAPNSGSVTRGQLLAAIGSSIPQTRIDDAVRRILTVKCEAGLFDRVRDTSLVADVSSEAHREVARQAVRESLVLLSYETPILPLAKGSNIFIDGSGANQLVHQFGGWTIDWQGTAGGQTTGVTVQAAVGAVATIVEDVAEADAVIVVLTETGSPYAEWEGDVDHLDQIRTTDWESLASVQASGKPVVALILSGRPVLITDHLDHADAWIAAWLPGSEGQGITDVLFGDANFTGTLSHSWPRTSDDANKNLDDTGFDALFPYGHGLTY